MDEWMELQQKKKKEIRFFFYLSTSLHHNV